MHQRSVIACLAFRVEAQHAVWVPARVANETAKAPRQAAHAVGSGRLLNGGLNAGAQLRRHALIGIDHQNPLTRCQGFCPLALNTKALPVGVDAHILSELSRNRARLILATRIEHHDFVGPGQGFKALT